MAAAQYVADQLSRFYTETDKSAIEGTLLNLLEQANHAIHGWGLMDHSQRSMGATTASLAWLAPDRQLHVLHAGDSAVFVLCANRVLKATTDHENGGGIFRYVGQGEGFLPEIKRFDLAEDDALCLVSDGVTKGLRTHQIEKILQDYAGEPDRAAKILVDSAKRTGVQDDITAIVVELQTW